MKKILFIAIGLISYQSFAIIGDTPYTLAKNLKAGLNCPKEAAYVTGTTQIKGAVDFFSPGVYSENGQTKINGCAATSGQTNPNICIDLIAAKNPGFVIQPSYLVDPDAIKALLIAKKGQTIPFDACLQKILSGNMTGYFGATSTTLNRPIIIRVLDSTELVHRD